ncbi:MAG TPA: AAA family ATPase [Candidatus Saccharimonadales bacterium]|nr:AAA family ATPase [Candidatus Saccharimonadales bacterium]
MSPTLNLASNRSQNARYGVWFTSLKQMFVVIISSVCVSGGIILEIAGFKVGLSLVGLSIIGLMLFFWRRWLLEAMPVSSLTKAATVDAVMETKLLGQIRSAADSAAIWKAALATWEGVFIAQRLLLPAEVIGSLLTRVDQVTQIWQTAIALRAERQLSEIDGGVVVAAILLQPEMKALKAEIKLSDKDINQVLGWQQDAKQAVRSLERQPYFGGLARDWASGYTPTLNRLAHNLSQSIEEGYYRHLPPVHEAVVDQMVTQLSGNRPRVALVGSVGVGKTSLAYDLAERLLRGEGGALRYYKVIALDASVLVTAKGDLEALLLQMLQEAAAARNVILFMDEAQLFFTADAGAVNLSNLLLNALQQTNIKLVLAFNNNAWQSFAAANPSLAGLMQKLVVTEPTRDGSLRVMQDAAIGIEHSTSTIITLSAVTEAYRLAERYLPEVAFPGKAITLLEQAAHLPVAGKLVTDLSVQQAVEQVTGAKVVAAGAREQKQLLDLESAIHERMVDQDRAVRVVADALRRSRAGVSSPGRPVGSFLFLGPTGVGKTELAKSLAAVYFGGESNLIRLDMSEYQQAADVGRLLAPTPPHSVGASLVSAIRQRPFSVVLLDEIEKAHPDILNLLLQILDEGNLTDSDDRQVSFKEAIVIATSNAGANEIVQHIESGDSPAAFEKQVVDGLLKGGPFRPELLNRFDEIVMFQPLGQKELRQIVDLMIVQVNANLESQGISVELDATAVEFLLAHGYDPRLGARPMRRAIQAGVENVVARRILSGSVSPGTKLALSAADLQNEQAN